MQALQFFQWTSFSTTRTTNNVYATTCFPRNTNRLLHRATGVSDHWNIMGKSEKESVFLGHM